MSQVKVDLNVSQSGDAVYKLADLDEAVNKAAASYSKLEQKANSANKTASQVPSPNNTQGGPSRYDPATRRWVPSGQQTASAQPIVIPPTPVVKPSNAPQPTPQPKQPPALPDTRKNYFDPVQKKWLPVPDNSGYKLADEPKPNNTTNGPGHFDPTTKQWIPKNQNNQPRSQAQDYSDYLSRTNAAKLPRNPFKGLDTHETGGKVAEATKKTGTQLGAETSFGGRFKNSQFAQGLATKSEGSMLGRLAGGGGMGGAAGGPAAIAIGAYLALTEAAGRAADGINIMNNASMSNAQKINALADEFVPGAQNLRKFREAIDGTTETMRRNKLVFANIALRQELTAQMAGIRREGEREILAARSKQQGLERGPQLEKYQGGKFDRGSYAGEMDYAEYQQRLAARDAVVKAGQEKFAKEREMYGQRNRVSEAERYLKTAVFERNQKQEKVDQLRKYEDTFGSRRKGEMDTALNELERAQANVINKQKALEEEKTKSKERQLALIQAESDLRTTIINKQKTELGIMEQKEQRMAANQTRLGEMSIGQYMLAKEAALHFKEHGVEGSTPEIMDLARQIAPEMVRKKAEKFGEGRAKELADLGIPDYERDYKGGETLEQVRAKVDEIKADIRVNIELNERELAKQIATMLPTALESLLDTIRTTITEQIRQQRIGQLKQNNNSP